MPLKETKEAKKKQYFQIQCDACNEWFIPEKELTPQTAELLELYHCIACIPYHGPSRRKQVRPGLRKRKRIDFVKLNEASLLDDESGLALGIAAGDVQEVDYESMLKQRQRKGMFKLGTGKDGCVLQPLFGEEFDVAYVNVNGFNRPVFLSDKKPSEIGLEVPPQSFKVADVATLVGNYRIIPVIDTRTQLTTEYTLQEWVEYLSVPMKERSRILNVISLEFSQTPMGKMVTEPKFARDLDFVNLHWPNDVDPSSVSDGVRRLKTAEDISKEMEELKLNRPCVQKYCLMTAAGSWTNFHVDFGGTSVWYHLFKGTKIFYFIEPTAENLKIYSRWAMNNSGLGPKSKQNFLPDLISAAGGECFEVTISEGQTLFIPSGWIHAVYTPHDSLVFGGNFVHRFALDTQLSIYRLERQMKVGKEFRFPNYMRLMWYVGHHFLQSIAGDSFHVGHAIDKDKVASFTSTLSVKLSTGYRSLSKELSIWSKSKQKHQFPPSMDVEWVAREMEQVTKTMTKVDASEKKAHKEKEIEKRKKKRLEIRQEAEERKTLKKERKMAEKVLVNRKKLEGKIEDVHWLQCDKCNEWREVSLDVVDRVSRQDEDAKGQSLFFCRDIDRECTNDCTEWFQCFKCKRWHALQKAALDTLHQDVVVDSFQCEHIGKVCCPKCFQEANIVLTA